MDLDGLAQVAYTAYAQTRDWRAYDGSPIRQWGELSPGIREGWRAAADAVRMMTEAAIGEVPE